MRLPAFDLPLRRSIRARSGSLMCDEISFLVPVAMPVSSSGPEGVVAEMKRVLGLAGAVVVLGACISGASPGPLGALEAHTVRICYPRMSDSETFLAVSGGFTADSGIAGTEIRVESVEFESTALETGDPILVVWEDGFPVLGQVIGAEEDVSGSLSEWEFAPLPATVVLEVGRQYSVVVPSRPVPGSDEQGISFRHWTYSAGGERYKFQQSATAVFGQFDAGEPGECRLYR